MAERSARAAATSTAAAASGAQRRDKRAEIAGKLRDALRELRIELAMNTQMCIRDSRKGLALVGSAYSERWDQPTTLAPKP